MLEKLDDPRSEEQAGKGERALQRPRATRGTAEKRRAASKNFVGRETAIERDIEYDLSQPAPEDWAKHPADIIERYYAQAESDFFQIVNDYLDQANRAAQRYRELSKSHSRWRFWTIVATGGLALINACAAFDLFQMPLSKPNVQGVQVTLPAVLNVIAAIYAGALTVSGNLENFFNAGEKATGFRESRDLLLNRYREYSFKWFFYVEAHGKTAKACANAGRLYRQLVDSDCELRQKIKQLTEVHARDTVEKTVKPSPA